MSKIIVENIINQIFQNKSIDLTESVCSWLTISKFYNAYITDKIKQNMTCIRKNVNITKKCNIVSGIEMVNFYLEDELINIDYREFMDAIINNKSTHINETNFNIIYELSFYDFFISISDLYICFHYDEILIEFGYNNKIVLNKSNKNEILLPNYQILNRNVQFIKINGKIINKTDKHSIKNLNQKLIIFKKILKTILPELSKFINLVK